MGYYQISFCCVQGNLRICLCINVIIIVYLNIMQLFYSVIMFSVLLVDLVVNKTQ